MQFLILGWDITLSAERTVLIFYNQEEEMESGQVKNGGISIYQRK
jgi:hypothetical protein